MKTELNIVEILNQYKITNIYTDTRNMPANADEAIFFANSSKHITAALHKGAKVIFTNDASTVGNNIFHVHDIVKALIRATNHLYSKKPKHLIAITGTSGKSSVASYCRQMLNLMGESAASLGSLGLEVGEDKAIDNHMGLNTPDYTELRKILKNLADQSIDYLSFEASSHGLSQQRLGDLRVQAAAFVSFSQDHLDYHLNMQDYLKAKLLLFKNHLVNNGFAVINNDTREAGFVQDYLKSLPVNVLTVGLNADLKINKITQISDKQHVDITFKGKNYHFGTEIFGSFQIYNLLIALGLLTCFGHDSSKIIDIMPLIKSVKGRLEQVTEPGDLYKVFIDHAHKPEALEKTLLELKSFCHKRLIIVFGCGGNRDKTKRPIMGKIASRIADMVIVTDDNPRFEDAQLIRQDILKGADKAIEIAQRKDAIYYAIDQLRSGDILVIAGKGNEEYQIIKDQKYSFSDHKIAQEALRQKEANK